MAPHVRKKLTKKEALFVDWQRVARVATVSAEGVPHNIPICPVLSDGRIAFATGEGRKVTNIRANSNVCVVFDEYTEIWDDLRQVMITGNASLVVDGPRFRELKKLLDDKYLQYPTMGGGITEGDTVIVEVTIKRVFSSGLD